MAQTKSVRIQGVELAYDEWPGKSPPVVFLHGLADNRLSWRASLGVRGKQRALAYDHRGHNDSGHAGPYTITQYGRDAVAFLEAVTGEPSVLIGHSLGALATAYVAGTRPELALGAVLIEPPLYLHENQGNSEFAAYFAEIADHAGKATDARTPVPDDVPPELREQYLSSLSKMDPGVPRAAADGSLGHDWDADPILARIRAPVLLLRGSRERGSAFSLADAERACARLADVEHVFFEDAGHMIQTDLPQRFRKVVSVFISEQTAGVRRERCEPRP